MPNCLSTFIFRITPMITAYQFQNYFSNVLTVKCMIPTKICYGVNYLVDKIKVQYDNLYVY
jgi:hypothetical protein